MSYPGIRIEGAILSPDILDRIEELPGQKSKDFNLDTKSNVKDEIASTWADAQEYWRIFQRKLDAVKEGNNATTETRNLWMVPLLGLLGYKTEYRPRGAEVNGQIYAISHRATNRADTVVQIIGARDPAGLDKKPANAARRMSAHALVQEFLNLDEQLYGLVTDGRVLRLLRDSSRLVKQSYLEFDLDRIFTDGLFADFAVLYRLLHATRLPLENDTAAESLIETYHQESLESGARIRDGLSHAVEQAILDFGNGFLSHPNNDTLRNAVIDNDLEADVYYQQLLRLIYRLLFLMVIEERDMIFPVDAPKKQRDIYREFYSIARLRRLAEKHYLVDPRCQDLWLSLQSTFRLFETDGLGTKLGIAPLAGDLFSSEAISSLDGCTIRNGMLLRCLRSLGMYQHPDSGQFIRVNYAALNVEEFGSVYEGLLEYEPIFIGEGNDLQFKFRKGNGRAATGSHYTPDDLVQPLIRHSLEYQITERTEADDPETKLLDLRVADIACGSGHILLAAARHIATELAVVRTGEEQPAPTAYRAAMRDVICDCIYGVDVNPLAVELCKVALWLEAHIPGQPLNFLDHHIKCGNAIVGFAHYEDMEQGVPAAAFKNQPGDDKDIRDFFQKENKQEHKEIWRQHQTPIDFSGKLAGSNAAVREKWQTLSALPERTPAEINEKKQAFIKLAQSDYAEFLQTIADIPVAQFYIPKVPENKDRLVTHGKLRNYSLGLRGLTTAELDACRTVRDKEHIFHWFLEFPEIMSRGGFDCILGNPPYLGGYFLSGTYGHAFCEWVKWQYPPAGLSELVVFFLRRIFGLLRDDGYMSVITTNSITDGKIRKDGLAHIVTTNAQINMAVRGMRWPGAANLVVSLLTVIKGDWNGQRMLDNQLVTRINSFLEADDEQVNPHNLIMNHRKMFTGSNYLGNGFLLSHDDARKLCKGENNKNTEVIMRIINGDELNKDPDQAPSRSIINFHDWPLEKAKEYDDPFAIVEKKVKPFRATQKQKKFRELWWNYASHRPGLMRAIRGYKRCFASARTTKHLNFSAMPTNYVFSDAINVFSTGRWDLFAVVQSTLHEVWARKYSGSLKQDLRYSPSDCFDTYPFPDGLWQNENLALAKLGEQYHTKRKELMQSLQLGLTKIYNLFHAKDLTIEQVIKVSKRDEATATTGHAGLLQLRDLHVELDKAVRDAYDWQNLELNHDFHEVKTLPENDRIRYTISTAARREVLSRLLRKNLAAAR